MTQRVYKYDLHPWRGTVLPTGAVPLRVGMSKDVYSVWALVSQSDLNGPVLEMFPTGGPIPDGAEYVGTIDDEGLILHVFQVSA